MKPICRRSARALPHWATFAFVVATIAPTAWSASPHADERPLSLKSGTPAGPVAVPAGSTAQTIYRVEMPDGSVLLSDTAPPGSRILQARSFAHTADPQVAERAREQGEYWQRQAAAFDARQRERDREAQEARRIRALAQLEQDRADARAQLHGVPVVVRRPRAGAPLVSPALVAGDYASSPGAASGRGGPLLGSGFAAAGNGMAFTPALPIPPATAGPGVGIVGR